MPFAITEAIFQKAVNAIGSGDLPELEHLLAWHPQLASHRRDIPEDGYFKHPYLLWFIADNPVTNDHLPQNIPRIAAAIIKAVRLHAPELLQEQLDYALALVATGRVPREQGVQLPLIDLLIDNGANPGTGIGALAHNNIDAAQRLIDRGGELTLAAAVCLRRTDWLPALLDRSNEAERQVAFVAAAFYGYADMLELLLRHGVNINALPTEGYGFHYHATALHQAVSSGSLEAVMLLVEAGADTRLADLIYHGTPLGWSQYMQHTNETPPGEKEKFAAIEAYLKDK
ncbi:ankyrin repeat domain-containing protein [Chitinophaga sp. GCM10012297]|uniref:Ankyrin repeat domain-containing protein n=1 Tax=Chitinophaga chungangae TaxID=2821488 RepID=A0ABS3YKL4_9BACT|nr:ankyrin repeat domain-containing protein [Chitinophaga chungangae]MBO9155201.1 ankyrin repeat domain-containing protein [Chitinophaga chungangae]